MAKQRALIGHSGFVGGNLLRQSQFDALYNSKNIEDIRGGDFALLVISGAPAVKWLANKEPDADLASIDRLWNSVAECAAERVVLISTVDVYPRPVEVTESTPVDRDACHAYGKHRLLLEDRVRDRFANAKVMRLPGLFGHGLKKNVIFDYLHDNETHKIDTRHVFQFYSLDHVYADVERLLASDVDVLNVSTEPVDTASVARICLGRDVVNEVADQPIRYDMRSDYAERFGGRDGYIYSQAQVLEDLSKYVDEFRSAAGG